MIRFVFLGGGAIPKLFFFALRLDADTSVGGSLCGRRVADGNDDVNCIASVDSSGHAENEDEKAEDEL